MRRKLREKKERGGSSLARDKDGQIDGQGFYMSHGRNFSSVGFEYYFGLIIVGIVGIRIGN